MVDDRYRVERKIGSGGMADVFLAHDMDLDRDVALKILHERFAQDQEFVERFRREASHAAGLQHPNVVGVFDRGEFRDSYYIAMEYVEGDQLKDLIDEGMTTAAAVEVTRQILEAERFAHKKGIVHRDIKPQNVMIDQDGRARVTDFGIAKAGTSDMTQTGSVMGTAQYLSPEQAQGKDVTAQSDIYSTGVVLYEALTGTVPFEADSPVAVALKQVQEVPRRPSAINPDVPPALDAVVMRALAKDPDQRFRDASAFIKALDDAETKPDTPRREDTDIFAAVNPDGTYTEVTEDDQAMYGPPPQRPWWHWALMALLVALVAGLVAFAMTGGFSNKKQVEVPNVTNQNLQAATAILQGRGFDVDTKLVPSQSPRNTVTEQDPAAGEETDEGSTITLTVSSGPGVVAVPDVQGLTEKDATKKLEDAGFQVTSESTFSNQVPEGRVAGTDPAAGTNVETGSPVKLLISQGSNKVEVPSLTGLKSEQAIARLEAAGLTAVPQQRDDPGAPPNQVVGQTPTAGTEVKHGSQVTIFVSSGATQIPNVVGMTKQEAVAALKQAGFKPVVRPDTEASPEQIGLVTDEFPLGGTSAVRGSTVQITVGAPSGGGTTTTPSG
jgi:eukaryotic-like serine/threonine-protein kinase